MATTIAAHLDVPTVGITDIVQAEFSAGTSAAIQAKQHMNAGELVPDTDSEVLRRLTGGRHCRLRGRGWHTECDPPARPGICDVCGGELYQRFDDGAEHIAVALQSYRPVAAVTLSHYRRLGKLVSIDATLLTAEIAARAVG